MLREYELMYIVRPELDDDAVRTTTEGVQALVENAGGEVTKTTPWGKRRLAYEVQHLRDGHYVLVQMRLDTARVTDLERALRISDTVFRHLLVVDESLPSDDEAGPPVDSASANVAAASAAGGLTEPAAGDAAVPAASTASERAEGEAEPVSHSAAAGAATIDEEV